MIGKGDADIPFGKSAETEPSEGSKGRLVKDIGTRVCGFSLIVDNPSIRVPGSKIDSVKISLVE